MTDRFIIKFFTITFIPRHSLYIFFNCIQTIFTDRIKSVKFYLFKFVTAARC